MQDLEEYWHTSCPYENSHNLSKLEDWSRKILYRGTRVIYPTAFWAPFRVADEFSYRAAIRGGKISTAERMAKERAQTAVVDVLTPICVEKFQQQTDGATKLIEFKKVSSS